MHSCNVGCASLRSYLTHALSAVSNINIEKSTIPFQAILDLEKYLISFMEFFMMSGFLCPGVETSVEKESWTSIGNNSAGLQPNSLWETLGKTSEDSLLEWRDVLVDSSSNHFC